MTRCRPNTGSSHQASLSSSLPLFFSTSFLRLFLGCAVWSQASQRGGLCPELVWDLQCRGVTVDLGGPDQGISSVPCDTVWTSADLLDNVKRELCSRPFSFVAVFSRMQQKLFSTATLRCSSETASVAFESLQSSGVGSSAQNMFLLLSWWWRSCCTARTFMMSVDSSASTKHFLNTCSSANSFYSDVWRVWCFQPQYVMSVVVEHSTLL